MLRLKAVRVVAAAVSVAVAPPLAAPRTSVPATAAVLCRHTPSVVVPPFASLLTSHRSFGSASLPPSGWRNNAGSRSAFTSTPLTAAPSNGFLRAARVVAPCEASSSASFLRTTAHLAQCRWIRVRGKDSGNEEEQKKPDGEEAKPKEEEEEKAKTEKEEEEASSTGKKKAKGRKGKAGANKKSFMDHIRGLRDDYAKFPDIYNGANAINFVVFTVFCLCSTGSSSEEAWWLGQWGLDNTFRPWTWFLHSFLTNNFLSMTYAMMLLHTMCHHVLPLIGSRGLMIYCGGTAVISGALMWAMQALYYGSTAAPEKQFGPWDIVAALFVMEYFYYGLTPFTILNSFSGWIKYAVWVGEVCILYYDWQPTVVGTLVGLVMCRGIPRFRNVKLPGVGGK